MVTNKTRVLMRLDYVLEMLTSIEVQQFDIFERAYYVITGRKMNPHFDLL